MTGCFNCQYFILQKDKKHALCAWWVASIIDPWDGDCKAFKSVEQLVHRFDL